MRFKRLSRGQGVASARSVEAPLHRVGSLIPQRPHAGRVPRRLVCGALVPQKAVMAGVQRTPAGHSRHSNDSGRAPLPLTNSRTAWRTCSMLTSESCGHASPCVA